MLSSADNDFRIAMGELCRPSEDLVQLAVCLSAKDVFSKYMQAYLLHNNSETTEGLSISQLMKQCRALDADFKNISLSSVVCRSEAGKEKGIYCLSTGRIKKCIEAAQKVRDAVIEKISK